MHFEITDVAQGFTDSRLRRSRLLLLCGCSRTVGVFASRGRSVGVGGYGKPSMYSKMAFASSIRVFHRRRLRTSTCRRAENDSAMALS